MAAIWLVCKTKQNHHWFLLPSSLPLCASLHSCCYRTNTHETKVTVTILENRRKRPCLHYLRHGVRSTKRCVQMRESVSLIEGRRRVPNKTTHTQCQRCAMAWVRSRDRWQHSQNRYRHHYQSQSKILLWILSFLSSSFIFNLQVRQEGAAAAKRNGSPGLGSDYMGAGGLHNRDPKAKQEKGSRSLSKIALVLGGSYFFLCALHHIGPGKKKNKWACLMRRFGFLREKTVKPWKSTWS